LDHRPRRPHHHSPNSSASSELQGGPQSCDLSTPRPRTDGQTRTHTTPRMRRPASHVRCWACYTRGSGVEACAIRRARKHNVRNATLAQKLHFSPVYTRRRPATPCSVNELSRFSRYTADIRYSIAAGRPGAPGRAPRGSVPDFRWRCVAPLRVGSVRRGSVHTVRLEALRAWDRCHRPEDAPPSRSSHPALHKFRYLDPCT
jgi:hypothetical protein